MAKFDYDVVIIGSGFGGNVAALRAAEKGYRVGVMESGKRWNDADRGSELASVAGGEGWWRGGPKQVSPPSPHATVFPPGPACGNVALSPRL